MAMTNNKQQLTSGRYNSRAGSELHNVNIATCELSVAGACAIVGAAIIVGSGTIVVCAVGGIVVLLVFWEVVVVGDGTIIGTAIIVGMPDLFILRIAVALLASCCGSICSDSAHHVVAWLRHSHLQWQSCHAVVWLWHCVTVLMVVLHVAPRLFCCSQWKKGQKLCAVATIGHCVGGFGIICTALCCSQVAAAVVYFALKVENLHMADL